MAKRRFVALARLFSKLVGTTLTQRMMLIADVKESVGVAGAGVDEVVRLIGPGIKAKLTRNLLKNSVRKSRSDQSAMARCKSVFSTSMQDLESDASWEEILSSFWRRR